MLCAIAWVCVGVPAFWHPRPGALAAQYETKTSGELKATLQEKTIVELEKALEGLDPQGYNRALLLKSLANAYLGEKDYLKATAALEKVLATKSLSSYAEQDILLKLISLYSVMEAYEKVVDTFHRWYPNAKNVHQETYLQLIHALMVSQRYHEGVKWLTKLVAWFPETADYWIQLASVYVKLDDMDTALAVLDAAYQKNLLFDAPHRILLARLLINRGAPYKAGVLLSDWLKENSISDSEENWELLATAWTAARERQAAVGPLKKLISLSDKDIHRLWLCQTYVDNEDWHEAIQLLKELTYKAHGQKRKFEKKFKYKAAQAVHELEKPLLLRNIGRLYLYLGVCFYEVSSTDCACMAFSNVAKLEGVSREGAEWEEFLDCPDMPKINRLARHCFP